MDHTIRWTLDNNILPFQTSQRTAQGTTEHKGNQNKNLPKTEHALNTTAPICLDNQACLQIPFCAMHGCVQIDSAVWSTRVTLYWPSDKSWASCQIRIIAGCACAGNAGNVSPSPQVSDPEMHHSTSTTHVPWYMTESPASGFLWSQWRGKGSRLSCACAARKFTYQVRGPLLETMMTEINGHQDLALYLKSTTKLYPGLSKF